MAKVNKERDKLIRTSVIFWIGVFMLYAALLGPFVKDVPTWRLWIKIVLLILIIILPIIGQVLIIFNHKAKIKKPQKR